MSQPIDRRPNSAVPMRPVDAARVLLPHLVTQPAFQHPSFHVEVDTVGGVALYFQGCCWGTWTWSDGAYRWVPLDSAGITTERRVASSAAQAAEMSVEMLGGAHDQRGAAGDDIWVGSPVRV